MSANMCPDDQSKGPAAAVETSAKVAHSERVARIVACLITDDLFADGAVSKSTLRERCGECSDREFGLALHDARERLRDEMRLEFLCPKGQPGVLTRATSKQKLARGVQFRGTAVKKLKRATRVLGAADATDLSSDDAQRLQMAQDRTSQMVTRIEQVPRMRRAVLPTGSSALPDFPARPK